MVMDMFYSYVETEKKKRVHFHGFMLDVHKSEYEAFVPKMHKCQRCETVKLRGEVRIMLSYLDFLCS